VFGKIIFDSTAAVSKFSTMRRRHASYGITAIAVSIDQVQNLIGGAANSAGVFFGRILGHHTAV
jgi:hypothetical protein